MNDAELVELATSVETREDLVRFLARFADDFSSAPEQWENGTLSRFLEALARWSEDMDGYYRNIGQDVPAKPFWRTFADMLMAARIYE